MYSFETKTIYWPKMYYARIPNQTISFNIIKFSVIKCNFSKKKKTLYHNVFFKIHYTRMHSTVDLPNAA